MPAGTVILTPITARSTNVDATTFNKHVAQSFKLPDHAQANASIQPIGDPEPGPSIFDFNNLF
jgi:hypothetical protein